MRHISLNRFFSVLMLLCIALSAAAIAHAQGGVITSGGASTPEIDPSMVGGGLALLGGAMLLLRDSRKK